MEEVLLHIPSSVDNIRMVEKFIDEVKTKWSIGDDLYGNIMIAITEAVNNAIIHGNKQDERKTVHLKVNKVQEKIKFIIEDQGTGFDYINIKDPTAPENLLQPGGRGIFLMKQLSNEINFLNKGAKVEIIFLSEN